MFRLCHFIVTAFWFVSWMGSVQAAQIEALPIANGMVIIIQGPLESGDQDKFIQVALQHPRAIVALQSEGGHIIAACSICTELGETG